MKLTEANESGIMLKKQFVRVLLFSVFFFGLWVFIQLYTWTAIHSGTSKYFIWKFFDDLLSFPFLYLDTHSKFLNLVLTIVNSVFWGLAFNFFISLFIKKYTNK